MKNMTFRFAVFALIAPGLAVAQSDRRPVNTYSIVARDAETGQLGVAVQSHWFSVGTLVPFAEAGVGAVATQSFIEVSYGPLGLELMAMGRTAPEALRALVSTDTDEAVRQVAMVDVNGNVAAHTGSKAIYAAGHRTGEAYSVQANLMENPTVWDAMAVAYENADGDLAERMLRALEAAEAEGGDIRGRQSAAILIVRAESTGKPWEDRIFDLRVEDHPDPVGELRRLVQLQRAYLKLNEGDGWVVENDIERRWITCRTRLQTARLHFGWALRVPTQVARVTLFPTCGVRTSRTRGGRNWWEDYRLPACCPTTRHWLIDWFPR